jgi:hypothetical protein
MERADIRAAELAADPRAKGCAEAGRRRGKIIAGGIAPVPGKRQHRAQLFEDAESSNKRMIVPPVFETRCADQVFTLFPWAPAPWAPATSLIVPRRRISGFVHTSGRGVSFFMPSSLRECSTSPLDRRP